MGKKKSNTRYNNILTEASGIVQVCFPRGHENDGPRFENCIYYWGIKRPIKLWFDRYKCG